MPEEADDTQTKLDPVVVLAAVRTELHELNAGLKQLLEARKGFESAEFAKAVRDQVAAVRAEITRETDMRILTIMVRVGLVPANALDEYRRTQPKVATEPDVTTRVMGDLGGPIPV